MCALNIKCSLRVPVFEYLVPMSGAVWDGDGIFRRWPLLELSQEYSKGRLLRLSNKLAQRFLCVVKYYQCVSSPQANLTPVVMPSCHEQITAKQSNKQTHFRTYMFSKISFLVLNIFYYYGCFKLQFKKKTVKM